MYSPNGGATTVPVSDYQSGGLIAVSPTAQTTYTLISASDANGCPANVGGNATVTVNPLPTATVSGGGAVCAGQPLPNVSIALTGMAPFTFTYSNGSSSTPVTETATNPYMIANAPARSYTVTSLSAANCTGTSFSGSATVTVNEGLNKVELRLGSLPSGIYLIRAIDALNQQGVVRVGKQ